MIKTINELEKEFDFFKLMAIGKLNNNELTEECLERIMDEVFWAGQFVGRCRERHYREVSKREL
jgi:hypothetical protein